MSSFVGTHALYPEEGDCGTLMYKTEYRHEVWRDYGDPSWQEDYIYIYQVTDDWYAYENTGASHQHCQDDVSTSLWRDGIETLEYVCTYQTKDGQIDNPTGMLGSDSTQTQNGHYYATSITIPLDVIADLNVSGSIAIKNYSGSTYTCTYYVYSYSLHYWDALGSSGVERAFLNIY